MPDAERKMGDKKIEGEGGDQLRCEVVNDMLEIKSGIYNSRLGKRKRGKSTKKRKIGIDAKEQQR